MSQISSFNSVACGLPGEEKDAAQGPYSRHGVEESSGRDFKHNESDGVLFTPSHEAAPVRKNGEDRCGVGAVNEQEGGRATDALDIVHTYIRRDWNPVP